MTIDPLSGDTMTNFYKQFFNFWETYNGFALLSLILGIICFFFPWFQKETIIFTTTYYSYLYIFHLFFYDIHMALFGLLYLFGFICLIFYYTGIILKNRGRYGTPFETHANSFFTLSVLIFLAFEVLMVINIIIVPFDADSGWFSWYFYWVCAEHWSIDTGFFLGIFMISGVISSFIYDRLMLRRHYQKYLPEYQPGQDRTPDDEELNQ